MHYAVITSNLKKTDQQPDEMGDDAGAEAGDGVSAEGLGDGFTVSERIEHGGVAVNTAMALPSRIPVASKVGSSPNAAPTAPRAVIGNAISFMSWNPNNHSNTQWTFSANQGRMGTP